MENISKSSGIIVDILIKINNLKLEDVAEKIGIHKTILLCVTEGKLVPSKEIINKICMLTNIDKSMFDYMVSYYDSIKDLYDDNTTYKFTIYYLLELTLTKELYPKSNFSSSKEENTMTNKKENISI